MWPQQVPGYSFERLQAEWDGYLAAMCDATGESAEAIEAWMDREGIGG
jgi:hypothetical protein